MKPLAALALALMLVLARAEAVKTEPPIGVASTSWIYTDNRGQYREMRFEPDGSLWIAYIRVNAKRAKDDPRGLMASTHEYEVVKERGTWTQDGASVRIVTSDEGTTEYPSFVIEKGDTFDGLVAQLNKGIAESEKHPTHPVNTYIGAIKGTAMSGTVDTAGHSQNANGQHWMAEMILEPKELGSGGPRVLMSCRPNIFRFQAQLFSDNVRSGSATVKAEVSPAGVVTNVTLVNATRKEFGICALEAVAHWKFSPKVKNRETVPCTVTVPVDFKLTAAP